MIALLILGKDLIIPFVLALFIWFLIKELRNTLRKIPFVRNSLPTWLQTGVSTLVMFLALGAIVNLVMNNIQTLSNSLPLYEKNIVHITKHINDLLNIDLATRVSDFVTNYNFTELLQQVFSSLTGIFSNAFLIILYVIFMLFEETLFSKKIYAIYSTEGQKVHAQHLIAKINSSISQYFSLKTVLSILTGVLSFIALHFIGLDAALFWAFIIFLLNYIPTIGSLIATVFPTVFALLQFGEVSPALLVLGVVGFIQLLVGNFLEPKVMGNSLNMSSLIVLVALSFWGALWGVTGMVLSVPITVMLIIIFAEFDNTKAIAILLSENGEV